ncbi:AAA family ATPase [Vibrio quintilis]|uniref:Orc1-like AAA ATPase domain-containing protein n=1 Tax=Vibrio quintilis TaxID=1117707 RepID=A0A1M7Z299_9VIBR|nr:ATP-binding protein [Vibrio quintilis]SHO58910.1 hypothetical protein VQ7734_04685 [Vibrio quintilis]
MLYRTVTHLASFFDVTIDKLMDDVPPSLWKYAVINQGEPEPCIGRDRELSQLQQLYKKAFERRQTVGVSGMHGLGKTNLIRHFLSHTVHTGKRVLYIHINPSFSFTARLSRLLLDISEKADDEVVRERIKACVKSSLLYFYLLRVTGVHLNPAEALALEKLSPGRLSDIEVLAVMVLLQQISQRKISVLAIDGLHEAEAHQLQWVRTFINNSATQPLLIILGITDVYQFSFLPLWLQQVEMIRLKPLDEATMISLANIFSDAQLSGKVVCDAHKHISVRRACGYPAILKMLIESHQPAQDCPEKLYQTIMVKFSQLSATQIRLLKFLACFGVAVSLKLIDMLFSRLSITAVTPLHELVCMGFLYPQQDAYIFRHVLIWEIVRKQVSEKDRQDWQAICQRHTFPAQDSK